MLCKSPNTCVSYLVHKSSTWVGCHSGIQVYLKLYFIDFPLFLTSNWYMVDIWAQCLVLRALIRSICTLCTHVWAALPPIKAALFKFNQTAYNFSLACISGTLLHMKVDLFWIRSRGSKGECMVLWLIKAAHWNVQAICLFVWTTDDFFQRKACLLKEIVSPGEGHEHSTKQMCCFLQMLSPKCNLNVWYNF